MNNTQLNRVLAEARAVDLRRATAREAALRESNRITRSTVWLASLSNRHARRGARDRRDWFPQNSVLTHDDTSVTSSPATDSTP